MTCWFASGAVALAAENIVEAPLVYANRSAVAPVSRMAPQHSAASVDLESTVAMLNANLGGLEIGYNRPVPDLDTSTLAWKELPNGGHILAVEFRSLGAHALSIQLRLANPAIETRVYEPGGEAVHGPYFPGTAGQAGWWSPVMFGERIGLEFYAGAHITDPPLPEFLQSSHANDFRRPDAFAGGSGLCAEDVICAPSEWLPRADAVVLIFFNTGSGLAQCTASLISRSPADQAPLLLTAEHCMEQQSWATSLNVRWFFRSATCEGPPPNLNSLPLNTGGVLLKKHNDADGSLIGLMEPPMGGTFLPWRNQGWGLFENMRGLHHAQGAQLQYIEGNKSGDGVCAAVGSGNQENINVTRGAVAGGASGSPGFDTEGRIRGVLSCGGIDGGCTTFAVSYGMLDTFWPNARWYLSNPANPCHVSATATNDPNGDGDRERGTTTNPFNTIYEATFCVPAEGEVRIAAGNYPETLMRGRSLSRPIRLTAEGGMVTIGRP